MVQKMCKLEGRVKVKQAFLQELIPIIPELRARRKSAHIPLIGFWIHKMPPIRWGDRPNIPMPLSSLSRLSSGRCSRRNAGEEADFTR